MRVLVTEPLSERGLALLREDFQVDVRPEVALRRIRARGDAPRWEELDPTRITTARSAFIEQPWGPRDNYRIVDGERPVDEIAATVRDIVATTLRITVGALT